MKNLFFVTERRNIFLFYVLTICISAFFIASNWLYFWTKYMTFGQLGWVDALGFGFGLLLEVPSGAIADLFGKKKTIIFGMLAGVLGVAMITFTGTLSGIFIGWLITQFAYAFFSGAAEAMVYDSLVDLKEEETFDKVITKSSELEGWTAVVTTLIGGYLYTLNFRLPHIFWGVSFMIGAVVAFLLVEPKVDTEKFSFKKYFSQLSVGIKELTHTELRKYIGFFFGLVGIYFMYTWGFIRPAMATSFGFFSNEQAIIIPILTVIGALVVRIIPSLKNKFSDIGVLIALGVLMSFGFILSSFPIGYYGIISMILITIAGRLATPWISILVNKRIESKNRATTLSTVALLTKLPYVLVAITAGKMIEEGKLATLNLTTGIVVLLVALVSFLISSLYKTKAY